MNLSKRAIASRANGAKSRGPKTSAGLLRSSQNSIRHGLLAKCVVIKHENQETFQKVLDYHIAKFKPADEAELSIVEEMVAAQWRMRRVWTIETTLFDTAIEKSTETNNDRRIAAAFTELAGGNQLNLLDRYEARLQRMYQRSRKTLLEIQQLDMDEPDLNQDDTELPNEPNSPDPDPGSSNPATDSPDSGADPLVRAESHDCVAEMPVEPLPNEPKLETEVPNAEIPNEPNEESDEEDEDDDDDDSPGLTFTSGGYTFKLVSLPGNIRVDD